MRSLTRSSTASTICSGRRMGTGMRGHHDAGLAASGHIVGHVAAGVVAVIGQEQFVARPQRQAARARS